MRPTGRRVPIPDCRHAGPHSALLAHAAEILQRKDAFIAEVLAQIQSEGDSDHVWKWYRDEIAELRVEVVWLRQPKRPDDGVIGLSGGRDYRCWRCDYTDGKPQGLGFDS